MQYGRTKDAGVLVQFVVVVVLLVNPPVPDDSVPGFSPTLPVSIAAPETEQFLLYTFHLFHT
jgi:hypothetical protein